MTERCTLSRREFIKAVALASTAPMWARLNAFAAETAPLPLPNHLLFVLYLAGGNDGLNTVVPYLDGTYRRIRPTVGMDKSQLLPLGEGLALHNALPTVHKLWRAGKAAIVQNVGYANPNFSHFDSTAIWESASPDRRFNSGWLGRYLDRTDSGDKGPVRAVAVGTPSLPKTITGSSGTGVTINSLADFNFADGTAGEEEVALRRSSFSMFRAGAADGSMRSKVVAGQQRMAEAVDRISGASEEFTIANPTAAQIVAQMFSAGVGTEIGFIGLGAFDTHVGQPQAHTDSLKQADDAIASFFDTAKVLGFGDRATVITFSDFGRRPEENAGSGTDHGTSMPMFLLGSRIRGGFYGRRPDLDTLDDTGNLVMEIPMQSVYASVLEQALRVDPAPILGGAYPTLGLFR